jgi:hypothetical protein
VTLVAALLEPALSVYTTVRLEFDDQSKRRVTFSRLEHAVEFHERAERLVRDRADLDACLAAAQTHPGFVQISNA